MGGISGMKNIALICNRSESTILKWIRERDFPAVKITGGWESDTDKIDDWRKKQIDLGLSENSTKKATLSTVKTRKKQ